MFQGDRPIMLESMKDTYTVVIFSSPLPEWLVNLGPIVQHIKWSFTGQVPTKNTYGTSLATTIFNTFKYQLEITKPLRIITIEALDENGEVPGETSKKVLTYLAKNILLAKSSNERVIDVILLPRFSPVLADSAEILALLWCLRKYTVLISNSCLHPALPSTETIAVSGATEVHSTPASVIDFVVTEGEIKWSASREDLSKTEVLSIDLAEPLGLGALAAVAVGIVDCLHQHFAFAFKGIVFIFKITL